MAFSFQQNASDNDNDNDNREKCDKRKRTDEISDPNERDVKKFCNDVQSMVISETPVYNSNGFVSAAFAGNIGYPSNNFGSKFSSYSNYSPNTIPNQNYHSPLSSRFHSANSFPTNNNFSYTLTSNFQMKQEHQSLTHNSNQICMGSFIVLVRTLTGRVIEIESYPQDTVFRLKERIQIRDGIPPAQQRLIHIGKALSDTQVLQLAGIKHKSTVHLVLGLKG